MQSASYYSIISTRIENLWVSMSVVVLNLLLIASLSVVVLLSTHSSRSNYLANALSSLLFSVVCVITGMWVRWLNFCLT